MSKKMNRRSFIKKSSALGVTSVMGGSVLSSCISANALPDISVVQGKNYENNTLKAVENLGGMQKFVPKNSKVAILANPQRHNPGAFTNPEVLKATIKMCKQAKAKEICCIYTFYSHNNYISITTKGQTSSQCMSLHSCNHRHFTM